MNHVWLYTARTTGLMAAAAAIAVVGVMVLLVKTLHDRLPVSLRLRLPTLMRIFAGIAAGSVVVRALALWGHPDLRLSLRHLALPTADPSPSSAGLLAVILMAVFVGGTLIGTSLVTYYRSSSEDSEGRFDSPTAILEEMRRRLEELPTLPEFHATFDEEPDLDLHDIEESRFEDHKTGNPFGDPTPASSSTAAPLPERVPADQVVQNGAPPLPTDAVDPATGEPDEAAYRAWLKEWLVYAEQYGDETAEDPVRSAY